MSIKSYNDVYEIYAWEDNNRTLRPTIGEGGIKYIRLILKDRQGIISLDGNPEISYVITKSNGKVSSVNAQILNGGVNGEIEIPIEPCLTDTSGLAKGTVRVITQDGVLKFHGVNLYIFEDADDKQIENSSEFSDLIKALSKVVALSPEDGGVAKLDGIEEFDAGTGTNPVASRILKQILNRYVLNTRKIAGIQLNKDIDTGLLYSALNIYPIIERDELPTPTTEVVRKMQFCCVPVKNNTRSVEDYELYLCLGAAGSKEYKWASFGIITRDEYVKNTIAVAGLTLKNDITVEQLQTALQTYPILRTSSLSTVQANIGQMVCLVTYDGKTYSREFYYCYGKNAEGVLEWTPIGTSSITDEQVASALEKYLEENPLPGVGTNGKNGKSAYEVALDNGFEGTEAEWLESLKGDTGLNGDSAAISVRENSDGYTLDITNTKGTGGTSLTSVRITNGKSGVYIGSDAPSDESVNIWIDPDGSSNEDAEYVTKDYVDTLFNSIINGNEVAY